MALTSGRSSLHKFGQSSSWALCIATHGEQSPAFTAKAQPKPVTSWVLGMGVEIQSDLGTSAPSQSDKEIPGSQVHMVS